MNGEFDFTGHRERVKKQFLEKGPETIKDYELLEMLLFYSVPRADTQVIGRRLLQKFGSIKGAMDAPVEELTEVNGVGQSSAILLKLCQSMTKRYYEINDPNMIISTEAAAVEALKSSFIGEHNEVFVILCLDSGNKLLKTVKISEGGISHVNANFRELAKVIINSRAAAVLVAHNHPSGLAVPSRDDIALTRDLAVFLKKMDAKLLDHIIFAGDNHFSMKADKKHSAVFGEEI